MVRLMADRCHHGKGEHDQRDVAMPAVPGAGLVVIETERGLGGLKAIFNCPAMAFDPEQSCAARSGRTPSGEKGEFTVGNGAADQQTARPQAGSVRVVFGCVEIGQFAIGPVIEPRPFGARSRRQARLRRRIEPVRDRCGRAGDRRLANPGAKPVLGGNPEHIAHSGAPQRHRDRAGAIDAVGGDRAALRQAQEAHRRPRPARSCATPGPAWWQTLLLPAHAPPPCGPDRRSRISADTAPGR